MAFTRRDVVTADGVLDTYLFAPGGGTPVPVVIMLPDAFGVRDTVLGMAQRLSGSGYLVAVPNIFYRTDEATTGSVSTDFSDPSLRAKMGDRFTRATPPAVMADLGSLLDALASEPGAVAGPAGIIGYCIGGRLAFTAATALGERIAAAASIHGGGLATDDPSSPYHQAGQIQGALYIAAARDDSHHTEADHARLLAALDEAKVDYEAEVLPALHGFAMPDFAVYDEAAAQRHWERSLALFDRTLRAPAAG
ncbi:dienelactone hydrolase [Frankia sp. R43]|uniref:dienelactone hydrolase family protein n=1 Tax=Frankia sp. R43 TaxID=269536 RepID=UPI0006CA184C|nr:dienelactone hydrolase family protein [Frankia sp. R43]KPM51605.1 dienelactone hydrolase [Frankia sp. R43]